MSDTTEVEMPQQVGTVSIKPAPNLTGDTVDDGYYMLTCADCDWTQEKWHVYAVGTANDHDAQHSIPSGLHVLADWLSAHPEMCTRNSGAVTDVSEFFYGDDAASQMARRAVELGGKWEKETDDYSFKLVQHFGPHTVKLIASRNAVCKRTVVGTTLVERKVPTAPLKYESKMVPEDVVEWECPPSLLRLAGE